MLMVDENNKFENVPQLSEASTTANILFKKELKISDFFVHQNEFKFNGEFSPKMTMSTP